MKDIFTKDFVTILLLWIIGGICLSMSGTYN
jgi:hypothetical protein